MILNLPIVKAAKAKADEIKGSAYALEQLRLLLKLTNVDEAEDELKRWLWKASHSRIPAFKCVTVKSYAHISSN